jgi:hypothetical protein
LRGATPNLPTNRTQLYSKLPRLVPPTPNVLLGQARATRYRPPLLLMLARASCIADRDYAQGFLPNGPGDVMADSSIAMPFPRWQAASTLAMSCPCSVLPIQWTSCQLASYMRKNHSHISLSCSQLLAFSPNCYSQPTSPLQSITRLLYDYYDLALVNDCCCACPPATLVNTLTTLSLPPPTERHPR